MAAHSRQFQLGGSANAGGGVDTTFTKIFVGGLAWETQRDTMRRYFEQFGEILEAVVITDKHTGRSKGYGFVTFKDPESAMRACQDPTPVIDGRRANCNLASLGAAHRSRPPTPHYAFGRFGPAFATATASSAYHGSSATSSAAYLHQPVQYSYPYSVYGYSGGYSQESIYPMNYYGIYSAGAAAGQQHHHHQHQQISPYYTTGPNVYQNLYTYYPNYAQTSHAHAGFTVHYPQLIQYPYQPQHYGSGILSIPASIAPATGVTSATMGGPSSSHEPPGSIPEPKPSA